MFLILNNDKLKLMGIDPSKMSYCTFGKWIYMSAYTKSILKIICMNIHFQWTNYRNGVGRTGVFCVVKMCLDQLEVEDAVDVFQIVKALRHDNFQMIQSLVSWAFLLFFCSNSTWTDFQGFNLVMIFNHDIILKYHFGKVRETTTSTSYKNMSLWFKISRTAGS